MSEQIFYFLLTGENGQHSKAESMVKGVSLIIFSYFFFLHDSEGL